MTGRFDGRSLPGCRWRFLRKNYVGTRGEGPDRGAFVIAEGLFYLAGLLDDKGFHDGLAFQAYYASVSLGIRTLRC